VNDDNNIPKKYQIGNYKTTRQDQDQNCVENTTACKKCHNIGHFVFHLNAAKQSDEEIELKIGVNHAHHILDKKTKEPRIDEGRNVTCYVDKMMINKKENCRVRYTLNWKNNKLPYWLRKRLQED
jgi:hypothetical protein